MGYDRAWAGWSRSTAAAPGLGKGSQQLRLDPDIEQVGLAALRAICRDPAVQLSIPVEVLKRDVAGEIVRSEDNWRFTARTFPAIDGRSVQTRHLGLLSGGCRTNVLPLDQSRAPGPTGQGSIWASQDEPVTDGTVCTSLLSVSAR